MTRTSESDSHSDRELITARTGLALRETLDGPGVRFEIRLDDRPIGRVELRTTPTSTGGPSRHTITCRLDPAHTGQGYATAACWAALGHARRAFGAREVHAEVPHGDQAGAAVALRLGFRHTADTEAHALFQLTLTAATGGAPIPRPTARVVLVDDAGRLLLFATRRGGTAIWYTTGGGVQPGETHEQAALRELREETGLTGVELGPEIWRGRPWFAVFGGVAHEVRQRYYLARVPSHVVDTSGFEEWELAAVTGHRWWTVDQLAATPDLLRPAGLPKLLADLLADGPPDRPITVPG
ncbi:GNAT family N-acetyltransferase [Streptomyces sp. 8K308]|uniref:GNAT family N-acetyltransferase n=1 Tax=Streptomyces sp. 8K308 TaxID=2530388 RepID=UPI00104D11F9|nr:GNAT family N-acetyltransferase [Streptomyces sp. 8K308]TDC26475.1 GNAT family N-acetyltransferase [Streptomyces sp. 8K308]